MIGTLSVERTIAVSENYDFSNTLNRLSMYHEMIHLMHQAGQRARNMDMFLHFHAERRQKIIINEEFDAYAMELEALDLLLKNQLKKAARNKKTVKPDTIMRAFGLAEWYRSPVTMLSMMAKEYFAGGKMGNYSAQYKDLVEKVCIHDGYALYYYGQPGVPQP